MKYLLLFFCSILHSGVLMSQARFSLPILKTIKSDQDTLALAFHIALGDVVSNIRIYKDGLLETEKPCLMAGIDYISPWTRDAAINTWNGAGLLYPDVCKNTLLSQLTQNKNLEISGQYWDKIIWSIGAWQYYLYSGDKNFLQIAYEATVNTLKQLEEDEFDEKLNLFRGPAVYGDGIGAYPDLYTKTGKYTGAEWRSTITKWVEENPSLKAKKGAGIPMHVLSTNCIYYQTYKILPLMSKALGKPKTPDWNIKAEKLRNAINKLFWDNDKKSYVYSIDPNGNSYRQEGLGLSFALLFEIADKERSKVILKNTYVEPAGIPCLYPSFERYVNKEKTSYGRHSGTVWPFIQGFWGTAAALNKDIPRFSHEIKQLSKNAFVNKQFHEIYHPLTGVPYGGIQESNDADWFEWKSTEKQTWSATGYIRMIIMGLFGMDFKEKGISFSPVVFEDYDNLTLKNLHYRQMILDISINGKGTQLASFKINGKEVPPFISDSAQGLQKIEILMQ